MAGKDLHVVVIGGTGNIGTSITRALSTDPEVGSVLALARRTPQWAPPKTTWVSADIAATGVDLAQLFEGADAVIHCAWLFQPSHSPTVTWRVNVEGTMRILSAVARAGVPALLCASSVGAYTPRADDQPRRPVDETWPTDGWPAAAYTREKAYVERLLDIFERDHPDVRVVRMRPAFVFQRSAASEQRRLFGGPFVPGRLVRSGLVPVVPSLPGAVLQVVHADDVAEAFRLALHSGTSGAFNLAAGPALESTVLAELLSARSMPVRPIYARVALSALWHAHLVPAPPDLFDAMLHLPEMDCSRAQTELGWQPRHGSRETIREFLEGLRDEAGDQTPPLEPSSLRGRLKEVRTGVGQRA